MAARALVLSLSILNIMLSQCVHVRALSVALTLI